MKKIATFSLLLLVIMAGLRADTMELTIDQAIALARQNNTAFLISQQEVQRYKQKVKQNLGFLPTVLLEGSKNLDEKLMEIELPPMIPGEPPQKVTLDFTKNYEFALQVIQPVFTGGKIWYTFKNAQIDYNISKERMRNSEDEVVLNVKKGFYNILVFEELLKTHQEALALAENNFNNVKQSYELGMVANYDLLRAEFEFSSVKPRILNTTKLIEMMKNNLKVMVGIADETEIKIKGAMTHDKRTLEVSRLVQQALVNRSELLQLRMETTKIRNLLKIAYAQFIPDFAIIARYSYRADDFNFTAGNWENYYTVNLAITFPIFTGLRRSAQVGEMRVAKKIMELNTKELSDITRTQVRNLYLTIQEDYENILLGLKNVEIAREGVRVADLNYQEGLITILELNTSYNSLTLARVRYLESVYNYNIALFELEKISGIRINGGES